MVDCKDKCVNWIKVLPPVIVCAVCTGASPVPENTRDFRNQHHSNLKFIYQPTSHQRGRGKEASLPSFTSSIFPTYLPGYLFNSMLWWCYGSVCVFTLLYSYRTAYTHPLEPSTYFNFYLLCFFHSIPPTNYFLLHSIIHVMWVLMVTSLCYNNNKKYEWINDSNVILKNLFCELDLLHLIISCLRRRWNGVRRGWGDAFRRYLIGIPFIFICNVANEKDHSEATNRNKQHINS